LPKFLSDLALAFYAYNNQPTFGRFGAKLPYTPFLLQGHPQSAIERKRRAWSESEDDEPVKKPAAPPSPGADGLSE